MWLALQCSLTVVGTRVGILLFDHFTHPIQLGQAGLQYTQDNRPISEYGGVIGLT